MQASEKSCTAILRSQANNECFWRAGSVEGSGRLVGVGGGDVQRVEVALVHGYDGNSFSSRAFWLELGSPRP